MSTVTQIPNHIPSTLILSDVFWICCNKRIQPNLSMRHTCWQTKLTYQELSIWGDGYAQDTGCVTSVSLLCSLSASRDDV